MFNPSKQNMSPNNTRGQAPQEPTAAEGDTILATQYATALPTRLVDKDFAPTELTGETKDGDDPTKHGGIKPKGISLLEAAMQTQELSNSREGMDFLNINHAFNEFKKSLRHLPSSKEMFTQQEEVMQGLARQLHDIISKQDTTRIESPGGFILGSNTENITAMKEVSGEINLLLERMGEGKGYFEDLVRLRDEMRRTYKDEYETLKKLDTLRATKKGGPEEMRSTQEKLISIVRKRADLLYTTRAPSQAYIKLFPEQKEQLSELVKDEGFQQLFLAYTQAERTLVEALNKGTWGESISDLRAKVTLAQINLAELESLGRVPPPKDTKAS